MIHYTIMTSGHWRHYQLTIPSDQWKLIILELNPPQSSVITNKHIELHWVWGVRRGILGLRGRSWLLKCLDYLFTFKRGKESSGGSCSIKYNHSKICFFPSILLRIGRNQGEKMCFSWKHLFLELCPSLILLCLHIILHLPSPHDNWPTR